MVVDSSKRQQWTSGITRKTLQGYRAFFPAALPVSLDYPQETVKKLVRATAALHRLEGVVRGLGSIEMLTSPYIRLEAVLSSRIEGTVTTVNQLLEFEAASQSKASDDLREVYNHLRALDYADGRLNDLPISIRLIRETHRVLMEDVRGHHAAPGDFRTTQNWIGFPGSTLETASFVPPPPTEAKAAMGDLETFLHDRRLPDLIAIGLAHYQFEAIHPFADGNGRIGRLLIILMLMERGILGRPVLYPSVFFEQHREDYYRLLGHTSRASDPFPWLDFFLNGLAAVAADATRRAVSLVELQQRIRERLLEARATSTALRLAEKLFGQPLTQVGTAATALGVSYATAQRAIDSLTNAGLLEEITGKRRNRFYAAREVLDIAYGFGDLSIEDDPSS
ncbi:MAG: Fic family protein [bacterium]|nr:Fic family protein [bacterium]